jgi:hypothetical protein
MRLNDLHPIQRKVLTAVAAGQDGEISVGDLKRLYETPRSDGIRTAMLIRHNLLEWVRGLNGSARAVRITDAGRILAKGEPDAAS